MPLLNYTTSIAVEKTAGEIMKLLTRAGAIQMLTDYTNGELSAIAFALPSVRGGANTYRLPVDPKPVEAVLRKQKVERRYQSPEQAARVAWRITKDWIEAQLAIIETQMVSADQVFLPYMLNGGRTLYEWYVDQQLALGPKS